MRSKFHVMNEKNMISANVTSVTSTVVPETTTILQIRIAHQKWCEMAFAGHGTCWDWAVSPAESHQLLRVGVL